MGLISDGHGSYMDPNTNKIVARTRTVSWSSMTVVKVAVLPLTVKVVVTLVLPLPVALEAPPTVTLTSGMVTAIPATPETPEARAAVPDHTPATAPANF